jgi:LEA14-like dessication related protein
MTRLTALAAALAVAALPGCSLLNSIAGTAFEAPKLTFESWSADAVDLEGVTIALHYRLDNPNAFGLDLERLGYRLEVEGRRVVEGQLPAGLHLAAKAASPVAVPVRLRWRDLPGFAEALLTRSDVGYRISGEAGVRTPLGTVTLPFEHRDRVALPRLPGLRVEGVSVRETTLTHLALDFRLGIANGNAFPLPVGALTYGLRVGEADLLSGGSHPLAAVPPGGHATITIPIRISLLGAASSASQILGGAEIRLRGRAGFGPLEVPVDLGGKVLR